jgi:hypothetical protein
LSLRGLRVAGPPEADEVTMPGGRSGRAVVLTADGPSVPGRIGLSEGTVLRAQSAAPPVSRRAGGAARQLGVVVVGGATASEAQGRRDREQFLRIGDGVEVVDSSVSGIECDEYDKVTIANGGDLSTAARGHRYQHRT